MCKSEIEDALHRAGHEGKDCKQGVTCRRLATARQLAPWVQTMLDQEYGKGFTVGKSEVV